MTSKPVRTSEARRGLIALAAFALALASGVAASRQFRKGAKRDGLTAADVPKVDTTNPVSANGVPARTQSTPFVTVASVDAKEPRFQQRPAGEWQGMLLDLTLMPICDATSSCPFGLICEEKRCVPCKRSPDCLDGEECVLDFCLRKELVGCRGKADCQGEALCVLSGFTEGPRHNGSTHAYCLDPRGGAERNDEGRYRTDHARVVPPDDADPSRLLNRVQQEVARRQSDAGH